MKIVDIKGPIISNNDQWIYDWLDMEATSPKKVHDQLKNANGEDIEVHINSGGGSVFDGSEIYSALKDYEGKATVKVVGLAASAASVIAMAGDKVLMAPTSQMMIHNASIIAAGDYRDMDHMSGVLKNVNQTVANAYKLKSGKSDKELLAMMDAETWMTPQQAMENGLIDDVLYEDNVEIVASIDNQMLPRQVINKIRDELLNNTSGYHTHNISLPNFQTLARDISKHINKVNDYPTKKQSDILMAKLSFLKLRKGDIDE